MNMEQLIRKAEKEGLWLHCNYQDLWFHPQELRDLQANGRFRWGPENFRLRNPKRRLETLRENLKHAQREFDSFKK